MYVLVYLIVVMKQKFVFTEYQLKYFRGSIIASSGVR